LPISEEIYKYGFYLPSGLALNQEDIENVAKAVMKVL
jgi:dTDP-4-amino-4,6-dideoxygalactose transaminase